MRLSTYRFLAGLVVFLAVTLSGTAQTPQVGSYTLLLRPGWNAIANPLDVGSNRVSELFPNLPEGTTLAKFNNLGGGYVLNEIGPGGDWTFDGGFAGTLAPGEGAFLLLPAGQPDVQLNISGFRRESLPLTNSRPGFNLVGCQSTAPCSFEELMGFLPEVGDEVHFFDDPIPPGSPPPAPAGGTRVSRYLASGWDVVPVIPGTRGVFVQLADRPRLVVLPPRLRVAVGNSARFEAQALFGQPTTIRWRFNGTILSNATNRVLLITNAQPANSGEYSAEAVFATGPVTSLAARLSVLFPPVITNQPQSLTVAVGATAQFKVGVAGSSPFAFQWYRGSVPIAPPLGTGSILAITNAQLTDAGNYFVIISNPIGTVTSVVAVLDVFMPPQVIQQPVSQIVNPGGTVVLSVVAQGSPPLMFQWLLNGNIIPGATGPILQIPNFQAEQAGSYRCVVSNPAGAVQSQAAELRLNVALFNFADFLANSALLSAPLGTIRGLNSNATLEAGEPPHAGRTGGRSVWVTYRSSQQGIVTFHTRGSAIDTLLAAYVGDTMGNLIEVASDDDSGGFLTSEITFNAQPNVSYRIVVDGLDGEAGEILLNWRFVPAGDTYPVITLQPKGTVAMHGQMVAFNVQALGTSLRYQWYFNGQPIPNAALDTLILTNVQPVHIGRYSVEVASATRTNFSRAAELDLSEVDGPGQPVVRAYDKFQDLVAALAGRPPDFRPATQVLGYTGSQTFSTAGSGGQSGEPVHCGVAGGHSKWYSYIAPTNGTLFINTDGSSFDTLLAVYTGCCTFNTLTPVACDNNSGTNGLASSLSLAATPNTLYFIAVDGVGGVTGTVKLNYRLLVPMMLTNLSNTTNSLTFQVNVTPSWPFTVQRSTNCADWLTLFTSNSPATPVLFTDTNLPSGRRFYRTLQAP